MTDLKDIRGLGDYLTIADLKDLMLTLTTFVLLKPGEHTAATDAAVHRLRRLIADADAVARNRERETHE
jgi:hypothetical protein